VLLAAQRRRTAGALPAPLPPSRRCRRLPYAGQILYSASLMEKAAPLHLDTHFTRNVIGVSLVEFLWGFGMPPVFESTFLQLFLHTLGATSFLIGLIPTIASAGMAVASLFSYTLTSHLERKRAVVIIVHLSSALPILLFGLILGARGIQQSTLALFLTLYGLFSLAIGLVIPTWQTFLMKIFSPAKAVRAVSVLMVAQSVAKLVGSLTLVRIVERFSFSADGASLVFTCIGALFFVGSLPFILTVENGMKWGARLGARKRAPADAPVSPPTRALPPPSAALQTPTAALARPALVPPAPARPVPARPALAASLRGLLANRRFLSFMGTDLEYFALSGVLAFYANYATEFCGIDPALASGLFMAFNYVGSIAANLLLGWAHISMRSKYLIMKSLSVAAVTLLALHSVPWVFYLTSLLFGASRGARMMVFTPTVNRLSGQTDATLYFAVAPVVVLPLSTGLPLLMGAFLDRFAFQGAMAYKTVFLAMAVLCLGGLFFATRMKKD
jgi:MFS family permease